MTREELLAEIWSQNLNFTQESNRVSDIKSDYIFSLEQRIAELESPKTCEGCQYEFSYGWLDDGTDICTTCSRDEKLKDYYKPKDMG